ncbi:MAG TPA: hypothetical protein VMF66_01245 [Candidatus Acidoferrum sp.]|nr:hypothetical protein [Candidatus Acidoferrum sp.]
MGSNRTVFFAALFAGILLAVPSGVHAQRAAGRTMNGSGAILTRPMRAVPLRAGWPIATNDSTNSRSMSAPNRWDGVRVNRSGNFNRANPPANDTRNPRAQTELSFAGAPADLQQLLNISPTNGFNWQYVNAINQDLPLKAIVDPVTRLEIAQAEHLLRSGGAQFTGAYILGGGYGYYMPEEAAQEAAPTPAEQAEPQGEPEGQQSSESTQPRVIVLQQKTDTSDAQESAPTAVPDEGPLTLVLRDGQKIEAIAFTVIGAKIVYITPDGTRKTIDGAELDSAATVRLNQENGTSLRLPDSLGTS